MISFARAVQVHQLLRQGSAAITMVALAHVGLAIGEIGNFEGLRYLAYALTAFWVNALGNGYLRIRQSTQHPQRWYIYYLLIVLLGGLLVFGLLATATPLLGEWLLDEPQLSDGLPFGLFILGSLAGSSVEQEAIADKASNRLLAYSSSSYMLQVALFIGPLVAGYPMYLALWGLAASALYRLAWVSLRYLKQQDAKLPIKAERDQFWSTTAGLSAYGLMGILVLVVDHALVGYSADKPKEALALWRYGAQELPLIVGIISALNATALAEMRDGAAVMLQRIHERSTKLLHIVMPLILVLMVTSRWWYPIVFSETFYSAHIIFNTMLLLVPSRLIVTTPILISLDEHKRMTYVGVFENIVNVLISLALVSTLGMLGIAIGTVIAYSGERLAYMRILANRGIRISQYLNFKHWVAWTVALLLAYLFFTDFSTLPSF